MKHKGLWIGTIAAGIVLVIGGIYAYTKFFKTETAEVVETAAQQITPELTYPGAYNGALYLTGEKTGSEAPFDELVESMDRNGVATIIGYFGVEADNSLYATQNVNTIVKTMKAHPGRFVPFYSTGADSEEVANQAGDELNGLLEKGLDASKKAVRSGFMKGIGEIELQVWQKSLSSPEVLEMFAFADANKLAVMIHTNTQQNAELETALQTYPNTTFLLHQFANDFERNRTEIIGLMQRNPNLMYTIDADHMMFDSANKPPIGLLYKYQDEPAEEGAKKFVQDFETKFDTLLSQAVARFQPLIAAMPDRVTIGTEMSADYTFEPEAYDRIIKFVRYFIGRQEVDVQEKLAHQNAERLFGVGLTLR